MKSSHGSTTQSDSSSSLQIVALKDILIHEEHDPSRTEPLIEALVHDGIQRHPVILARNWHRPFVHLDGANRIAALSRLGCRHIAAQVLDYTDPQVVALDTWLHLTQINEHGLLNAAETWRECRLEGLPAEEALELLAQGQAVATILFADGEAFALLSNIALADRVEAMRRLINLYAGKVQREIWPKTDVLTGMRELLDRHTTANACIAFAPLSKAEIVTLACNLNVRLPAGITRHMISCGRVLNVNVPLSLLEADLPATEKTRQLQAMLAARQRRVYMEPTVIYEPSEPV